MRLIYGLFLLILALFVQSASIENLHGIKLVNYINSLNTTFKARSYKKFDDLSVEQLKQFVGAKIDPEHKVKNLEWENDVIEEDENLPSNFNVWTKWPECVSTFKNVQDQGYCGSCFAVATSTALTDRRCIKTGGKMKEQLSAWDVVSCCKRCYTDPSDGCLGGYPARVYEWFASNGIVSGGAYKGSGCLPYPLSPYEREWDTACLPTCQAKYTKSYVEDKRKGSSYQHFRRNNINGIMKDIMENGPVTAVFNVYQDFFSYESGVYQHKKGDYVGGHVVKIVGWGVGNDGTKYWKVLNSWGDWGEDNGFFRIIRGTNNCGFEEYIMGGKVSNDN